MDAVSVSALTKYLQAKFTRDVHLQHVKLCGELSNVKFHNKGHLYFTLKDEYSRIAGVAFSQSLSQMNIDQQIIEDGLEVEIEGSVRVYEVSGTYQIYANKITPSGIGFLQKQYEQLLAKYEQLGYFDIKHKQEVPKRIHRLAIITAEDGAAIEDMRKSIINHIPHVEMILFPTLVQGESAPQNIAKAIQKADAKKFDAIIVGRGGGSLEDLWAFNTMEVIEAIFAAQTPIISAVGHEVDTMLSDYVADFRAPTPTAAIYYFDATMIIENQVQAIKQKLIQTLEQMIRFEQQTLQLAVQQLKEKDPKYQVQHKKNILDIDMMRLFNLSPQNYIDSLAIQLSNIKRQIQEYMNSRMNQHTGEVATILNTLNVLNPSAQLNRGYAMVYDENQLITQIGDIKTEFLNIRLRDGQIHVKVVNVDAES